MAERVATLYFEDNNIRLLIARGKKAERWASIPLEPGLVSGGVIVDESQVAKKVRELFVTIQPIRTETTGIKKVTESIANLFRGKGKIIVGLGGRGSLYRVLSLPPLAESVIAEAVRREAGRVLPISLDEVYLAYQRIPGSGTETRVFVAAFPKKATDALLRTLRTAGFTPRILDLEPLALCLLVNEPRAIIVDARLDTLSIMIMAERVPQVIRNLALQSETNTLSENMPNIIEEFNRTIAFYNSSHPQDPINSDVPVFVSGHLVKEPDMWKSLVGGFNYQVFALPSTIQEAAGLTVSEFIVNIGLATKVLALEKQPGNYSLVNLNALPASSLRNPINLYRILIPVVVVMGIAGVLFVWHTLQVTKDNTKSLQSQVTSIQNQISSNSKSITELTTQNKAIQAQIQPAKDAANVFPAKLNTLTAERTLTDSSVHQIVALVPTTVMLTTVTYSSNETTVAGSSATQADILAYAKALRDANFKVVVSTINYSSTVTDANVVVITYRFSFQIK